MHHTIDFKHVPGRRIIRSQLEGESTSLRLPSVNPFEVSVEWQHLEGSEWAKQPVRAVSMGLSSGSGPEESEHKRICMSRRPRMRATRVSHRDKICPLRREMSISEQFWVVGSTRLKIASESGLRLTEGRHTILATDGGPAGVSQRPRGGSERCVRLDHCHNPY